ncbi:MAG TPA: DUF4870 domain-containing protein [Leptolyngbyaceae cyanobacterium]
MNNSEQRKLLSALSHGAIFFSSTIVSVAVPIAILFISDDPVVKDNARESLNFHINIYIYGVIFLLLAFLFIGIPLLILLAVASIILPIIAIVKVLSNPERPYRYPFLFRLL